MPIRPATVASPCLMLDTERPVPLLRYQTGDVVRILDSARIARQLERQAITLPGPLPEMMLASRARPRRVAGRFTRRRVQGRALFRPASRRPAQRCLPADCDGSGLYAHVQLVRGARVDAAFEGRVGAALSVAGRVGQVIVSPYDAFPVRHGSGLREEVRVLPAGSPAQRSRLSLSLSRELPAEADAERATVLRNSVLQMLVRHRDRVVQIEEVADRAEQLERAPERLDHCHVRRRRGRQCSPATVRRLPIPRTSIATDDPMPNSGALTRAFPI